MGGKEATAGQQTDAYPLEFADELGIDLAEMRQTPSGMYVLELEEGRGLGARPGHVLSIHYTGWLINGEVFDTSAEKGPLSFQLGARQVIRGWEEGVAGMRIGGKRRLIIPPGLAFGSRGQPGAIPPYAMLIYEIELLDIKM
jgi:FKBP-type peptidyl-prolyl cis-trans isomerase